MFDYQHRFQDGRPFACGPGKMVCVGRNFAEHARELDNPIPTRPIFFIKPSTAAVPMTAPIQLPQGLGVCDYELEMTVLIGESLTRATQEQARAAIAGLGLGLDLTLRDLQDELKSKGQPWERAKAFDGACPLSVFVDAEGVELQNLDLRLTCNGMQRQAGNTHDMLFPVLELLVEMSESFTLLPGDVVLTGTPAGVGPLRSGDALRAELSDRIAVETRVL